MPQTVIGSRIGAYEVLSPLGAGGMGEVFRAKDVKLGRDVAIKVLPAAFASDPDRLARFQREAQVLASLNHPNIAAIYGLEDGDGRTALVLEFVDGETLADRLVRGPIHVDDALLIAQQIADALHAAHDHGVIHRDLKPANIKLAANGKVKVLDFGLAKLTEQPGATNPSSQSMSPTITSPAMMTNAGMVLGTAAYMSPEQAKGRSADKRSDVWAFGCVLYEMLTGRRAFSGENVSDTLAAVLRGEPDWSALSNAPAFLRRIVVGCLTKDHQARIADFSVVSYLLRQSDRDDQPVHAGRRSKWAIPLLATAATALAAGAAVWATWRPNTPAAPELRLEVSTPPTWHPPSFAISPDGQRIVFVATSEGTSRLWIRPLDSATARPLDKTEGARAPFWSPDGRSVGFFAPGVLKRVDVDAIGSVQDLADAPFGGGGTWAGDVILFSPQAGAPIRKVAATGGPWTDVTRVTADEQAQFYPEFLPDGRHFLYFVLRSTRQGTIYVGRTDSPESRKRLLDADSAAAVVDGHLLFVRQRTLFAQQFDFERLELKGAAVPIAEGIIGGTADGVRGFSAVRGGPIVYRTGNAGFLSQLSWFDRDGREQKIAEPDQAFVYSPSLSPNNRQVALWRVPEDGNIDIWLVDVARGIRSKFTLGEGADLNPIWSPDGERIVYLSVSARERAGAAFEQFLTSVAGGPRKIGTAGAPTDWSRTGDHLLLTVGTPGSSSDIVAMRIGGAAKPIPVVQTPFREDSGKFSRDAKWIAYRSFKSTRSEVYVQPFPGSGGEVLVSANGGAAPRWNPAGNELFYVALDGKMMSVRLDFSERQVVPSKPVALFGTRIHDVASANAQQYDVSNDGKRFLINSIVEQNAPPLIVLLNWKPGR